MEGEGSTGRCQGEAVTEAGPEGGAVGEGEGEAWVRVRLAKAEAAMAVWNVTAMAGSVAGTRLRANGRVRTKARVLVRVYGEGLW